MNPHETITSLLTFHGMPEKEVTEFLDAFPTKKELAKKLHSLAVGLHELMIKNERDGIPTVIKIIDDLRTGNIKQAKNMYQIDGDKLHSYPDIEEFIKEKILSYNE